MGAVGESGEGIFGGRVALSGDGNTALISAYYNEEGKGAAWVYTRTGPNWTEQAKLTGSGEKGKGEFGESVALSADGNTALITAPNDNSGVGAAWIFSRSGSTWTLLGSKLTGTGATGSPRFGYSAAISGDGNTALIGGVNDNSEVGAAWVFIREKTKFVQQGSKLTGAGETGKGEFGTGVALSSEGNTAVVTGGGDNSGVGAVWAFTRSGTKWSAQGSKIVPTGEVGKAGQGLVALSASGNEALVDGAYDNKYEGAVWYYTRSGTTWSQTGSKITASGEEEEGFFGSPLAMASNGAVALIGGSGDNKGYGVMRGSLRALAVRGPRDKC